MVEHEAKLSENAIDDHSTLIKLKRARNWSAGTLVLLVILYISIAYIYLDLSSKGWTTYPAWEHYESFARTIAIDRENRIWVGSYDRVNGGGVSVLDPGGTWRTYTSENSDLADDVVNVLVIDLDGNVWVGSRGLSMLSPDGRWASYQTSRRSGYSRDHINAMAIDGSGRVWVGTMSGLNEGHLRVLGADGNWTSYNSRTSGLIHDTIYVLAIDDEERVWAGTAGGLSIFAPDGTWTNAYSRPQVRALAIDAAGRVWVGTGGGLNLVGPDGSAEIYAEKISDVITDDVRALSIDNEARVWVGTWKWGFSGPVGGSLRMRSTDGSWTTYTSKNSGLVSDIVESLTVDNEGYLWVGTDEDLNRFDVSASTNPRTLNSIWLARTSLIITILINSITLVVLLVAVELKRSE
jgi:ligand-binding sensor domain-containing protein